MEPLHAELHPEGLNMAAELPYETLIHLLSFLPIRDLLRGPRGVSHVWRDAALDATLWQHRDMCQNDSWLPAALRLVPRARSLSLTLSNVSLHVLRHAADTDCVFTNLEINGSFFNGYPCIQLAREVVVRQVMTGQLRTLILSYVLDSMADLVLMAGNAGLTSLSFNAVSFPNSRIAPLPVQTWTPESSLRHLQLSGPQLGREMELLVSSHRSTLETVDLSEVGATRRMMELLGSCPRLREARLYTSEALCHLTGCPRLTSLTLFLSREISAIVPAGFFEGVGKQLTKLEMQFGESGEEVSSMLMDALRALSSPPGESALKELRLFNIFSQEALLQLPCILRGLPHLHTLQLNVTPPAKALNDIYMKFVPNLRKLRLHTVYSLCQYECPFPALYRLVKRMPLLHVTGLPLYHRCIGAATCKCCQGELHAVLARDVYFSVANRKLCLFGEALPDADCGSARHHSSTCDCVWVCVFSARSNSVTDDML